MNLKLFRSNGTCAADGCLRPWDTRFDKSSTLARSLGDFRGFCLCDKHTREAVAACEASRAAERMTHEGDAARYSGGPQAQHRRPYGPRSSTPHWR